MRACLTIATDRKDIAVALVSLGPGVAHAALRDLDPKAVEDDYRAAGILVNTDGRVPIDEAGPAYKPTGEVVDAVVDAGLATVEYELRPLASLKGRGK